MKKLLALLCVVTLNLTASAQLSAWKYRGDWMGVVTPGKYGVWGDGSGFWDRSTIYFTVYDDGSVDGGQYDFFAGAGFDYYVGNVSDSGRLIITSGLGDSFSLHLSRSGRGTGVIKAIHPDFPSITVRQTVTLFRRNPR